MAALPLALRRLIRTGPLSTAPLTALLVALLITMLTGVLAAPLPAAVTHVAVAANFTEPAKAIAAAFERTTGHRAVLAFGASGAFYTQIRHGAPFDILLSADDERPARIERDRLAAPGTRFTYATGRLALYSAMPGMIGDGATLLRRGGFERVAIADPAVAPYGTAAIETMRSLGVEDRLRSKLVTGSSIAQTYQFVSTGAAPVGFVALSQVIALPGGSRWIVPARLHRPIVQQAVLLRAGAENPAARAFLRFLRGTSARAIIRRHGYEAG